MLGSHLSISGSMVNAIAQARVLGMDTVQVFTKNQQQWKAKPLDAGMVKEWRAELFSLGWHDRTVSHASYLANLASVQDELWNKSIELMIDEVERCEQLHIPLLVHHPGSFVGSTLEHGISRIAQAYKRILKATSGYRCVLCLEGTAGAGSSIGGPFEHLRDLRSAILDLSPEHSRVGYCLDTCHLHVAGHDMSTKPSAQRVLQVFDEMCGATHLRAWHLNDSKGALGSHLDRHEHIGLGFVGGDRKDPKVEAPWNPKRLENSGFAAIMQDPRFASIPKILETPKEEGPKADKIPIPERFDSINARRLRGLCADRL